MNSNQDLTAKEFLLKELKTWKYDAFEKIFLGWCLNNLNSQAVATTLLGVDENWFLDAKRKIIYSATVACILESSAQKDSFISTLSVESAAEQFANHFDATEKDWAEKEILQCCAYANKFIIGRDTVKNEIVPRWKVVLGRPRVKEILDDALIALAHEDFDPGEPEKVTQLLAKANSEWFKSNYGVADDHELTEDEFYEQILVPMPEESVSVSTGLEVFDQFASGGIAKEFVGDGDKKAINTEAGRIITIAARPGCGKTALLVSLVHGIAHSGGKGIIYTLEVPIAQIYARAAAIHDFKQQIQNQGSLVDGLRTTQFGRRTFTESQRDRMQNYKGKTLPNVIVKERLRSIDQIVANVRLMKRKDPDLRFIAIDHLGCISHPQSDKTYISIKDIMDKLLALVNELKIDVILLCQLNRSLATRSDKRPTLTDLRDSGSIEEFSHIVIGLYKQDDESASDTQEIEIHALKNRNGPTGMKKAMFYKRYSVISNATLK